MSTIFRGSRRLIDSESGEILETQVVEKLVGDAGFHKIWLGHILDVVDQVGNQKMRVLVWLLSKADSQNQVLATYAEIAAGTNTSARTVGALMRALKEADVITESRRSLWRFNPSVIFQGDHRKRMNVLIRYRDESQADLFEEPAVEAAAPKVRQLKAA